MGTPAGETKDNTEEIVSVVLRLASSDDIDAIMRYLERHIAKG